MEIIGKSMKIVGNGETLMEIRGKSMKIVGKWWNIHGNGGKSMKNSVGNHGTKWSLDGISPTKLMSAWDLTNKNGE